MKRREFIGLISGVAATWPLVVRAQQPAVPVIGYLSSASSQGHASYLAGFHDGLREGGFIEGQRHNRVSMGKWSISAIAGIGG